MNETAGGIDSDEALRAWVDTLKKQLNLGDVPLDIDTILGLAGVVAHAIVRPAAPVTTFLVGYAAGSAAAKTAIAPTQAIANASAIARNLASSGNVSSSS